MTYDVFGFHWRHPVMKMKRLLLVFICPTRYYCSGMGEFGTSAGLSKPSFSSQRNQIKNEE